MLDPFDTSRIRFDQSSISDAYRSGQDIGSDMVGAGIGITSKLVAAKQAAKGWKERQQYTAKLMQPDAGSSAGGILGAVGDVFKIGTSLASLCERRLKQQIRPLDDRSAWQVVRDLPIYQFEYRHRPGVTVYGPMVDEVEAIDPLLVRPMDYEAAALGIADGQPIRGVDLGRQRAYETLALQQALRRVESLEARVLELEARLMGAPATSAAAHHATPCWGGLDELPVVYGGPA